MNQVSLLYRIAEILMSMDYCLCDEMEWERPIAQKNHNIAFPLLVPGPIYL